MKGGVSSASAALRKVRHSADYVVLIALAGMVATANILKATEQIEPISIGLGLLSVGLLTYRWARKRPGLLVLLTVDLALIFTYAWSLGPPSGVSVSIHEGPRGFTADVDGNVFFQKGQASRIGLYASAAKYYVTTSNGGRIVTGSSPLAGLARDLRFAVPGPAWSRISLTSAGTSKPESIGIDDLATTRGRWSLNPRNEIAGSLGAVALVRHQVPSGFVFQATLMRPDGTQGILLTDPSGRNGYLLAIRMDHRDARFYYWHNGDVGVCTCQHPPVFPVTVVPMIQRLMRYFLPSVILAMALFLASWVAFLVLHVGWLVTTRRDPFEAASWGPSNPPDDDLTLGSREAKFLLPAGISRHLALATAGVIAAVGTASAALIALNNNQTLPTIEDTSTYLFQAKTLALGRLWAPVPEPFGSFSLPFTISFNGHWFGKYPPGWPALLAIGSLFDKGWMVAPVVGGISLLLIYLIGRELYSPWVGVLAALFALSSPFFLSMAGSLLSQSATWMWCGLFAYLVVCWFRREQIAGWIDRRFPADNRLLLVGAGAAIGIAFGTRQLDSITMTFPFGLMLLRKPLSIAFVSAGAIWPLVLLVLYNIAITGNPTGSGYTQAFPYDHLGFGSDVGGPTVYEMGYDVARGFWNIAYDLEHLQIGLFGWPFFLGLALALVPFVSGRAQRWDWLLAASCVCVVIAYGCYWASGVTGGFPRYWFALVPWLCILAARGAVEMARWPAQWLGRSKLPPTAIVFPAAFLAAMAAFNVRDYLPVNVLGYRNPEGAVVAAVKAAGIHHALIFQHQNTSQDSEYEVIFSQDSPLLNGDIIWAVDRGPRWNRLVMQSHPGRSYYKMNGVTLTPLRRPLPGQ